METNTDTTICQEKNLQADTVLSVINKLSSNDELLELSELFKILGDHTRVRILQALYFSELCVCELVEILKMTQSAISHQLRVLRTAKVVKYRKEGKNVYYSLDDTHIFSLIDIGMQHINEEHTTSI